MADQTDGITPAPGAAPTALHRRLWRGLRRWHQRWTLRLLGWLNIVWLCIGVLIVYLKHRMFGDSMPVTWLFPGLFLIGTVAAWSGNPMSPGLFRFLRATFAMGCMAAGLYFGTGFLGDFLREMFSFVSSRMSH